MVPLHRFLLPVFGLSLECRAFVTQHRIQRSALISPTLFSSSRPVVDWAKNEPFELLLPQNDFLDIVSEILSDPLLIDDSERLVSKNWESLEKRLLSEERSIRQIIGEGTTERVLESVQNLNEYDPEAVKAFLGSEAVNALFARVLYDGIFEFVQKIDIFGNIINSLPVIGPIRQQIVREAKRNLDKSLGPLVQSFLGTYTKIAVMQAIEFILSPSNRKSFGSANVRLVSSLLQRPVNSLLPPSSVNNKLKEDAFAYIRNINMEEVERYVDSVYGLVGDKTLDDIVEVDRIIDASPTLQKTIDRVWERAKKASEV